MAIIDSGVVENTSMQELLTRLEVETFLFDLANLSTRYQIILIFVEQSPHKLKVTIDKEKGLVLFLKVYLILE